MKIYLAKSNRANPNALIDARRILLNSKVEVLEHEGGSYDAAKSMSADSLVILPHVGTLPTDLMGGVDRPTVIVGKGLYSEIDNFSRSGKPIYILTGNYSPGNDPRVFAFDKSHLRVVDSFNWVSFAEYTDRVISCSLEQAVEKMKVEVLRKAILEKHRKSKHESTYTQVYRGGEILFEDNITHQIFRAGSPVIIVDNDGNPHEARIEGFEVSRGSSRDYLVKEEDTGKEFKYVYAITNSPSFSKVHLRMISPVKEKTIAEKYDVDFIL